MDFVFGLPRTQRSNDAVWVIVDRLTKSAHFLAISIGDSIEFLAELYVREIVHLHGVPVSIVSDRDPRFTAKLWQSLQSALGTQLNFSTAYNLQTDEQSERVIQILEDMLRACALDFKRSREKHLPLVEFGYNNSFQASIGMAPFKALYGRLCRSPVCWIEVGDSPLLGPDLVHETTEKIALIQKRVSTLVPPQLAGLVPPQTSKPPANPVDTPFEFEVDPTALKESKHDKLFKRAQGVNSIPGIEDDYTDSAVTLLDRFKMPYIDRFDGSGDPMVHLRLFSDILRPMGLIRMQKLSLFGWSLSSIAAIWLMERFIILLNL
ncbi:uncharacterized protein LOC114283912 [Camellia sinensis]|uniref:uncharacterized protein LOC114283912 n=1 Tax=Camellia sinensis TaxID=4442 RepID=UPI001035F8AC|nr:uncharacterized protein LOC114283912 [Camellia sinensis]